MNLHNLSHFLQIWLFPPGLILLLFLIGFSLYIYDRHRKSAISSARAQSSRGKYMIILSFVLFWVLSTHVITHYLIDGLQKQYPALSFPIKNDERSAIVVLGSGVEDAIEYSEKRNVSDKTLARLHYAVYLYHQTNVPIIASGGNRIHSGGICEANLMREILINTYQVPVLFVENQSHNTKEEALLLAPLLKQHQIERIYLVTHAFHMPRSMIAFKAALEPYGIAVVPAPMGYINLTTNNVSNYLPLIRGLNTSVFALHEYVGILWYRLIYRM